MRATKIAFEKRYSDDSGVEFGVRLNDCEIEFESMSSTVSFSVDAIDWLIASLKRVREEIELGKIGEQQ